MDASARCTSSSVGAALTVSFSRCRFFEVLGFGGISGCVRVPLLRGRPQKSGSCATRLLKIMFGYSAGAERDRADADLVAVCRASVRGCSTVKEVRAAWAHATLNDVSSDRVCIIFREALDQVEAGDKVLLRNTAARECVTLMIKVLDTQTGPEAQGLPGLRHGKEEPLQSLMLHAVGDGRWRALRGQST